MISMLATAMNRLPSRDSFATVVANPGSPDFVEKRRRFLANETARCHSDEGRSGSHSCGLELLVSGTAGKHD